MLKISMLFSDETVIDPNIEVDFTRMILFRILPKNIHAL